MKSTTALALAGLAFATLMAGCGQVDVATLTKNSDGTFSKICPADPNLLADNILKGISIYGVTGAYPGVVLASGALRTYGSPQRSLASEAARSGELYSSNNVLEFAVPNGSLGDGYSTAASYVDRTGWTGLVCGQTQNTLEERIADCAKIVGANATYDGPKKAFGAEGVWKLVSRKGDVNGSSLGQEVWRDERTGLLWSSLVTRTLNWCKASGYNVIPGNPALGKDDGAQCSSAASYQNQVGLAISACFEDGEVNFTNSDTVAGRIDPGGKAGLGFSSTPRVGWRLPTKFDYLQADLDGIRFVLPDTKTGTLEWTATNYSLNNRNAFTFDGRTGLVSTAVRNTGSLAVRCVGR